MRLDSGESACRFGLNCSNGMKVEIENVISRPKPGLHRELSGDDAAPRAKVKLVEILNKPTGGFEIHVDRTTGALFG